MSFRLTLTQIQTHYFLPFTYSKYDIFVFSTSVCSDAMCNLVTVTKQALHKLSAQRIIGIQEAAYSLSKNPLVICSDNLYKVRLTSVNEYTTKSQQGKKKDLISVYRDRPDEYSALSVTEFFEKQYKKNIKAYDNGKYTVLLPSGLNCKPVYPVDYFYARGMVILHHPWSRAKPIDQLLKDRPKTVNTFLDMVRKKSVPVSVINQLNAARMYEHEAKLDLIAKRGTLENTTVLEEECSDDEWDDILGVTQSSSRPMTTQNNDWLDKFRVNIGEDYPWNESPFRGTRDLTCSGETYLNNLRDQYYNQTTNEVAGQPEIPTKRDGSGYGVDQLNEEQRLIVLMAVDTVMKFLTNHPDYEPMRATILGQGGTGKSFIINTIISVIRRVTNLTGSVKVAAPSGSAAWNVRGCTLHRLLGIKVDKTSSPLSEAEAEHLQNNLKRMLVLMIDERSQINSKLIAVAERNCRVGAFNGKNQQEYFGGVPVVIIFGDDCQLPPVAEGGAIAAYNKQVCNGIEQTRRRRDVSDARETTRNQATAACGELIFTQLMISRAFILTKNMRVNADQQLYRQCLTELRVGEQTEKTSQALLNLSLHNYPDEHRRLLEQANDTLWLCATNEAKDNINRDKLIETSKTRNVPVARLNCYYYPGDNKTNNEMCPNVKHFDKSRLVAETNLCQHARVAIDSHNFIPEIGLYNGTKGDLIEFAFSTREGPNDKQVDHNPKYTVIDCPDVVLPANFEPWDRNHPTVSDSWLSQNTKYSYSKHNSHTWITPSTFQFHV